MNDLIYKKTQALIVLSQQTNEVVIITDSEERIEWINQGFTDLTKYTFDEVKGKKPGHILQGPETDPQTVEEIRIAIKKKVPIKKDILNYNKYGDKYWLRLYINPVFEDSKLVGFVATEIDLTEHFKQLDHLKELSKKYKKEKEEKQEIIKFISHDFKNLLNTTINLSEIMLNNSKNGINNSELNIKLIKEISINSRSMHKLLEQYLGKNSDCLFFDHIESRAFLKDINLDIKIGIVPKNINIKELQVVLDNLLINAIKFTNNGGKISVRFDKNNDIFCITIIDNGVGIPENRLKNIFDKKYTTIGTDGEVGFGLGLLKCKKIVEKNGGKIYIESSTSGTIIKLEFNK